MERKLIGVISTSGERGPRGPMGPEGPQGPVGPAGGVNSFNARQGEVVPEFGDYSLSMVGAEMLTNTEIDDLWNNL